MGRRQKEKRHPSLPNNEDMTLCRSAAGRHLWNEVEFSADEKGLAVSVDLEGHTDYDMWRRYTAGSRRLGVPCIFYAERFMLNWNAEPATSEIPLSDLAQIAQAWR